jgi:hypothetical protein
VRASNHISSLHRSFKMVINTEIDTPGNKSFSYTIKGNEARKITIYWGDGTLDRFNESTSTNNLIIHEYSSAGIYTVRIIGDLKNIKFLLTPNRDKITILKDWGSRKIRNLDYAFDSLQNINGGWVRPPKFHPDLNSLSRLFFNAPNFNYPCNDWNVSQITNFNSVFRGTQFNQNIDSWNVSNGASFFHMFRQSQFNQNIDNWNMANATDITGMFENCPFNQPLNSWNVGNVQIMSNLFSQCPFNQPLNNWRPAKVTNLAGAFANKFFDQNVSGWSLNACTTMALMFYNTGGNPVGVGTWNIPVLQNAGQMFQLNSLTKSTYDALLTGWTGWNGIAATKVLSTSVSFHAGFSNYSAGSNAAAARNYLVTILGWSIVDSGAA